MEQSVDLAQQFIDKRYLVDRGVAAVLLHPELLLKFLGKHDLLRFFSSSEGLATALFIDADINHPEYPSVTLEHTAGSLLQRASPHVMLDALLREEHLCPVRIMHNGDRYELLLAPLSERNIELLDQFYSMYRIDIARAYRVRKGVLKRPFSSKQLPACLATLFIEQNSIYEQGTAGVDGMLVSDGSCNPDATIMAESPEKLAQLFTKENIE